jgi:hypothetical protein
MAIINKGKSFANGEQLTADKLNQVIDNATFTTSAVDNVSTQLSSGAIIVKDGGVTTAKLNDGAVTKAKIENVANMKVLGNTSGSAAAPQEVSILDEDDMSSDSATALSTQQSIKAYVDSVTIGINQTWQAVTRVIDDTTEYTNSTAKPITVLVNARYLNVGGADDLQVYMRIKPSGGSFQLLPLIDEIGFSGYSSGTGSAIIPPGSTYKFLQGIGGPTITNFQFYELR